MKNKLDVLRKVIAFKKLITDNPIDITTIEITDDLSFFESIESTFRDVVNFGTHKNILYKGKQATIIYDEIITDERVKEIIKNLLDNGLI